MSMSDLHQCCNAHALERHNLAMSCTEPPCPAVVRQACIQKHAHSKLIIISLNVLPCSEQHRSTWMHAHTPSLSQHALTPSHLTSGQAERLRHSTSAGATGTSYSSGWPNRSGCKPRQVMSHPGTPASIKAPGKYSPLQGVSSIATSTM